MQAPHIRITSHISTSIQASHASHACKKRASLTRHLLHASPTPAVVPCFRSSAGCACSCCSYCRGCNPVVGTAGHQQHDWILPHRKLSVTSFSPAVTNSQVSSCKSIEAALDKDLYHIAHTCIRSMGSASFLPANILSLHIGNRTAARCQHHRLWWLQSAGLNCMSVHFLHRLMDDR